MSAQAWGVRARALGYGSGSVVTVRWLGLRLGCSVWGAVVRVGVLRRVRVRARVEGLGCKGLGAAGR
eukprot:5649764-Pyramimonas_sp.AAC.1